MWRCKANVNCVNERKMLNRIEDNVSTFRRMPVRERTKQTASSPVVQEEQQIYLTRLLDIDLNVRIKWKFYSG